jgi:hypothetical protein
MKATCEKARGNAMHRATSNKSRDAAAALIGATPSDVLDHIIERAEAARCRYLGHLSEPQLRTYSRHHYLRLLNALDLQLENLRTLRDARKPPA